MALEETNKLDIVFKALDGRANGIDLMLFDHGQTTEEGERFNLLPQRFSTYLAYAMSDDLRRAHPQTTLADVKVRILCENPPNTIMQKMQSVSPRGDRINCLAVTFESLDEFTKQAGL